MRIIHWVCHCLFHLIIIIVIIIGLPFDHNYFLSGRRKNFLLFWLFWDYWLMIIFIIVIRVIQHQLSFFPFHLLNLFIGNSDNPIQKFIVHDVPDHVSTLTILVLNRSSVVGLNPETLSSTDSRNSNIQLTMAENRNIQKQTNFVKCLSLTFIYCHGIWQSHRELVSDQCKWIVSALSKVIDLRDEDLFIFGRSRNHFTLQNIFPNIFDYQSCSIW